MRTQLLTVLSVAYPLFPVTPDSAGGAEQIVSLLDREFSSRHVRSLVMAATPSNVRGRLFSTMHVEGEIDEIVRRTAEAEHAQAIRNVLATHRVDLIHFHGLDFGRYIPPSEVPMLATMHLPLAWYPAAVLQQKQVQLNCVSHSQAAGTGLPVVTNGINTARYVPSHVKAGYFLWLGRVCPEKGVHLALAAARSAGVPLVIAGPVHPFASHQQYFRDKVEPLLDGLRQYAGPVEGREKLQLLANARALLVTSSVAETSSLVAMEAASSGTPVIALRTGALPEIVTHGETGFIADSAEQLSEFLPRASEIDPERCRSVALQRFSAARMADDYLALYKRILGTTRAPQEALYAS